MYIVLVGAGKIGKAIASWLIESEHEVTLVDRSKAKCESAEDELGSVAVLGDGAEAGVLSEAGSNRADVLIAATGYDDVNLVVCQLGRHHFGIDRTICLIHSSDYERLYENLGITSVVNATDLIIGKIQESMSMMIGEQTGRRE